MNSTSSPAAAPASFKKGDIALLVTIQHGPVGYGSSDWSYTSENFRTRLRVEQVMIQSFGKKQGTAITSKGNLLRRLYASYADSSLPLEYSIRLVRTEAEVFALAKKIGASVAATTIARFIEMNENWLRDYACPGGRGLPIGVERTNRALASLRECVALPPVVEFV